MTITCRHGLPADTCAPCMAAIRDAAESTKEQMREAFESQMRDWQERMGLARG